MKGLLVVAWIFLALPSAFSQKNNTAAYFPPANTWEKRSPALAGFDTSKLNAAIRYAIQNESRRPRSMRQSQQLDFGKEPFNEAIGPFVDRGDPTGIIIHKGFIIAEWGDPSRVEMTHSVTKSFLSTVVGLAVDKGLIKNVNDLVGNYVRQIIPAFPGTINPSNFDTLYPFHLQHNKKISWEVMLRQTSDWEGSLWSKPDWADRPDPDSTKWLHRKRNEPGSVFEYNDVRVNALALAATWVWKRSLPGVLRENIMNPIGASNTWQWQGYYNSWFRMGDTVVQSVSGGGHWGGGMFINAYDMGRFGLLSLHKGNWNDKQLISEKWMNMSTTPTSANPEYGYMNFYLNSNKKFLPSAPASAFAHVGNGRNIIYVDREHELIMVVRWIENNAFDGMVKRVLEALK